MEETQDLDLTSEEVKYLESVEKKLATDLQPFIRLSANLHVGYNGECEPATAEKVERWMRETLFRAQMLHDVLQCNILIGWDEERSDVVIAIPPEGYKEAFDGIRVKLQEYAEQLKELQEAEAK